MSKRNFPALLILWVVLGVPLNLIFSEALGSALTDRVFDFLEHLFGVQKAQMIAAVSPYVVPGTFSALAIYAAYRVGLYERAVYEPLPDLDPRVAFERIRSDRGWLKKHIELDPEKRAHLRSDYLDLRADAEIHAAVAQKRMWVWGSKSLPKSDGPFERILAEQWQEMEIVFGPLTEGTRVYSKWRAKDSVAYVGLKFNAAQIAKEFFMKKRRFK